jgi:membrane protease subunit HflC
MSRRQLWAFVFAGFAVLVVLGQTFFIVGQREAAIVLRLGQPVRVIHALGQGGAGLKVKTPFLERVIKIDRRNLGLEADQEEVIAGDQQRLVVDAFLRYRISDPLQYYRTLRDDRTAAARLEPLGNSALRQVLGQAASTDIISGRRAELMTLTRADVARRATAARFGVEVIDLRIKRADLPAANQAAVYRRMQTARQQEAAQIRAVGEQKKREIIAGADKEVAITIADATEKAQATRGEGDAQRTRIFAQSYGRDPGFASFYRSMQAYDAALGNGDATVVLSPDSAFFRYFSRGPVGTGGRR